MNKRYASQSAFSLVEVTIAVGIAAFCLVAILGLFPVGLSANASTVRTTEAAAIAKSILTDLRVTPIGGESHIYEIEPDVSDTHVFFLDHSGRKMESISDADLKAVVEIQSPPADVIRATRVNLLLTWPASTANSPERYEIQTMLDRTLEAI
jgi:uncharacterized protein (TIGR02598 family)